MNLQEGNTKPVKQTRKTVTLYWEHQVRGLHLISTLELFNLFPFCGSLLKSKLAPFILNSWMHRVNARASARSLCNCCSTFQYLQSFTWTRNTITRDVHADRTEGIHHFLQWWSPEEEEEEDVNKIVKKRPWKTKKKQHSWKISLPIVSFLDSFLDILLPKRSSSLCQSLRSRKWPGLWEISANGWLCIAETVFMAEISFCWCSSSTGISTMWASLISAID